MGTLGDLVAHAESPTGNALNALDFPMPQASMSPTPFASDAHALLRTVAQRALKTSTSKEVPTGDFRWGLAATTGAFHAFHIDSNGLATFIVPQAGQKWWVVARPIDGLNFDAFEDIELLIDPPFDVNSPSSKFSLEAILLKPGMKLWVFKLILSDYIANDTH